MGNNVISDGVCIQSIEHPGCVWDAKFLENGDIVTACSDGVIRIWTVNHDKIADAIELESYFSQLTQHKISRYGHLLFPVCYVTAKNLLHLGFSVSPISDQCYTFIYSIL